MQREWILSVDVGTSSVKATIFNDQAELMAEQSCGYPLVQPQPGWVEQDPHDVLQAFERAIQNVLAQTNHKPQIIVLSTAMHALMGLDDHEQPLTRFLTWADQRAEELARKLRATPEGLEIYQRTGTPIHAMSPLLKLAWFRESQPELFTQAKLWVDLKAYLLHELVGEWVIDESLASATGLFNLKTRAWDEQALTWCGVNQTQLPRLVKTTDCVGIIPADLAQRLGTPENTKVIAGASDGALANLGVGAVVPGSLALSIGTSGAARQVVKQPQLDPEGRLFCYVVDDEHYIIGGPINNGGIVLRWLEFLFGPGQREGQELASDQAQSHMFYETLNKEAAAIAPGSEGLFCLPYLTGERAPLWREDVSGSFWGLRLTHTRGHLMRAVLEGISYQLNSVVKLLEELAGPAREIRATGGFTQSKVWTEILTDILGNPLGIPKYTQGTALGGAFLAWSALGQLESLEQCAELVPVAQIMEPNAARKERYQKGYALFQDLVHLGETQFPKLNEFANGGYKK
ncbi:gluconokinase [Desulfitobacterium sp.]|uniref:gluconokinase n=1 Tax=Desulfitobacterium sp. TaxID=49981 RepID=UPI002CF1D61D|nr:gluconokinase [Desulfitobacterium sp.]HVJ47886.1 gluconokinase [Desulfitobacterium sp.]